MVVQGKNNIFKIAVIVIPFFMSFSSLLPCLAPEQDPDYKLRSSSHTTMVQQTVVEHKNCTHPVLAALYSQQNFMEQQPATHGFSPGEAESIDMLFEAFALSDDNERVIKIVTKLKCMSPDLYGKFAQRIYWERGIKRDEKLTLLSVLQYMPDSIDVTRMLEIESLKTKIHDEIRIETSNEVRGEQVRYEQSLRTKDTNLNRRLPFY